MMIAPITQESTKREANNKGMETTKKAVNKGAWTPEEDRKLADIISVHGAKKWKIIAAKAGLNRCGKSCRLRWLNYLRPNIKRGNISDQEEDLILRLHKLLGNRWSLIAGRLPGRTDNEIKNYWNSHLSKKMKEKEKQSGAFMGEKFKAVNNLAEVIIREEENTSSCSNNNNNNNGDHEESNNNNNFNVADFFDFSNEDPLNLDWATQFLEIEDGSFTTTAMS